jgi:L-cysteine S-thiosulfotransferase
MRLAALPVIAALSMLAALARPVEAVAQVVAWRAAGDGITQPLASQPGDAVRGRAVVANRQVGLCLLCHSGPFPEERFQGNLAPPLDGAGTRLTPAQLRLRIADSQQVNAASIMPPYHRTAGLQRVGRQWQDQPVLTAQQVEDVVAFLETLK